MRLRSLTARFLLTLLLSTALPFLAFGWYARAEMEARLERQVVQVFLPDQARVATEEIRAQLERIELGLGMLRDVLAKDLRAGRRPEDFDERVDFVVNFDPDLVLLVDEAGTVHGARLHPRLDRATRAARTAMLPRTVADAPWFRELVEGGRSGRHWETRHLSPFLHKTPAKSSQDPKDYSFALAYTIPTTTAARWAVYALFSWSEVQRVLDRTARFLQEQAGFGAAEAFLCDAQGRYLGHSDRARYADARLPLELAVQLPAPGAAIELPFPSESGEDRRAGVAALDKPPFEWWVGVHAPSAELLATSRDLSTVLLVVTAVTAVILVVWSMVASRAILRPVRRLAAATASVGRGDLTARVPARGPRELAELGRAFNRMAEDLDHRTAELRHAERQAAWAEMARQVAHEIKNPLTPMRMSAQLLQRAKRDGDPRLGELTDRLARTVLEQTEALSRIASEFRQFAGPPQRALEQVLADELLRDAERHFAAMAEGGPVAVAFHPGAAGARVEVDREELRRVLLNLLHNAREACGASGRVAAACSREGERVVFRVEDDGPGVTEEAVSKLFDPYFTTKSSGTGLGLAICRRIVEAHGGRIELESSRPGRTVFRFEIPVASG